METYKWKYLSLIHILEQLKESYGLFGNDVYESLPANVFEYTPEIV